ncbi:GNAT family N-acetyltransferase [Yoonia sediminilitoris]|nr:GNAT family N-acetyltransferase [Yoonia sediminilitoris]
MVPPLHAFATQRLSVQEWSSWLEDPKWKARLISDLGELLTERVLIDLPPSMATENNDAAIENWIIRQSQEGTTYVVQLAGADRIIGLLILAQSPERDDKTIHLGYLLAEDVWGHGYASELVLGLTAALAKGASIRLCGGVSSNNPASARVLKKAGFRRLDENTPQNTDFYILDVGWSASPERSQK